MILFFVLFLLASVSTTYATDIVSVDNRSDKEVTIRLVNKKDRLSGKKESFLSVSPHERFCIKENHTYIPVTNKEFNRIEEQASTYLEIKTLKGLFYCVEGNYVEECYDGAYGDNYGIWLQTPDAPETLCIGNVKKSSNAKKPSNEDIVLTINDKGEISACTASFFEVFLEEFFEQEQAEIRHRHMIELCNKWFMSEDYTLKKA